MLRESINKGLGSRPGRRSGTKSLVRFDELPLAEAQKAIAEDWVRAYEKYIGPFTGFFRNQLAVVWP
jgi:hypothetical protein